MRNSLLFVLCLFGLFGLLCPAVLAQPPEVAPDFVRVLAVQQLARFEAAQNAFAKSIWNQAIENWKLNAPIREALRLPAGPWPRGSALAARFSTGREVRHWSRGSALAARFGILVARFGTGREVRHWPRGSALVETSWERSKPPGSGWVLPGDLGAAGGTSAQSA